jgi:hypothetical protein
MAQLLGTKAGTTREIKENSPTVMLSLFRHFVEQVEGEADEGSSLRFRLHHQHLR